MPKPNRVICITHTPREPVRFADADVVIYSAATGGGVDAMENTFTYCISARGC